VWLANCYGRADFTGNRAAQVNWLSLSERIRWQRNDRIRETLCNEDRKYRMISFQVLLEVDRAEVSPSLRESQAAIGV
jgi:hypothetical protein